MRKSHRKSAQAQQHNERVWPKGLLLPAEVLLLAAIALAIYMQAGPVREQLSLASGKDMPRIASDDDLYSAMLGRDYDLVRKIRHDYPKGTPVLVDYKVDNTNALTVQAAGAMGRMFMTLWPDYCAWPGYEIIICAPKDVRPTDKILGKGQLLYLVERKNAGAAP